MLLFYCIKFQGLFNFQYCRSLSFLERNQQIVTIGPCAVHRRGQLLHGGGERRGAAGHALVDVRLGSHQHAQLGRADSYSEGVLRNKRG